MRITQMAVVLSASLAFLATAAAETPSVAQLGWLAQSWQSQQTDGGLGQQVWLAPGGGSMLGVFRLTRRGKLEFAELLTIGPGKDGLTLTIRRLGRTLEPLEGKRSVTSFRATQITADKAVFESGTAQLTRISYLKTAKGMTVRVVPRVGGAEKPIEFHYTRAAAK